MYKNPQFKINKTNASLLIYIFTSKAMKNVKEKEWK